MVKQLLLIEPPLILPVLPLTIPLNIQMLRYDMLQNDMLQYEDTMLRYVKIQNMMIMMMIMNLDIQNFVQEIKLH